jgi:hypothetical protein
MKVLLNVLGTGISTTLIILEYLFIPPRICEAEVDGAGKGLPHLATQAIRKTDLNEARRLRIADESEVATVGYGKFRAHVKIENDPKPLPLK